MRLIDADKLYLPPEDLGSRMAVAYAPTAYDVRKVIRDLEYACYSKSTPNFDRPYEEGSIIDLEEAIDIVKRGGIDGQ